MNIRSILQPDFFVSTHIAEKLQNPTIEGFPRSVLNDEMLRPNMSSEQISRLRERHDFPYWCQRNLTIIDKLTNRAIPFRLNTPQVRIIGECEKLRLSGKPIHIIVLKARQCGCTTVINAYMLWHILYHQQNANLAICGNSHTIVGNILNSYRDFLAQPTLVDSLYNGGYCDPPESDNESPAARRKRNARKPPSLKKVAQNTYLLGEPLSSGNKIIAASANNPNAARGMPVTMIHATEVAYWRSTPKTSPDDVMRSLCNGLPNQGDKSVMVLESTANGTGNYFHGEWINASAKLSNKVSVFIPWYEIPYHRLPIPKDVDIQHFIDSLDEYEHEIFTKYNLSVEQINWYKHKRKEFREHIFMMAEYPTTPQEAFAASNRAVFTDSDLDNMEQRIIADDNSLMPPDYGDLDAKGLKGDAALTDIRFVHAPPGVVAGARAPLVVWKHPDKDNNVEKRYIISVDIGGRAASSDYTVISVFDRKNPLRPELVAQWRGHLDYDLLAWKAAQIAQYYCIGLLAMESNSLESGFNSTNGKFLLDELHRYYRNVYHRNDGKGNFSPGFHMNRESKEKIINRLIARVRDGTYRERALEFVNEARHYEYKTRRFGAPMGAANGEHDDIIISRAIGLSICSDLEPKIAGLN